MKRHFCEAQNQGNGAYTKTKQTSKKQNYPKQKQRYKYYNNKLQWKFSKKLTRNQYFNYILTKTGFLLFCLYVCLSQGFTQSILELTAILLSQSSEC